MKQLSIRGFFFLFSMLMAALAQAGPMEDQLLSIQQKWAEIKYHSVDSKAQEKGFEALAKEAEGFVKSYPDRAEPLVWQGIVLASLAGASGGLGALGKVKQAKVALESSLKIDDKALEGSGHTSLGSLYYQVPGWPIGFGDDELAEQHLKQALEINPRGIDSNFFYADFLMSEGRDDEARKYFQNALQAPPREQRAVADEGRRAEIQAKLAELEH